MNTTLKWVLGGLVAVAIVWAGVTLPKNNPIIQQIVGASAGPTVYDHQYFLAGITTGGTVATTSGLIGTYSTLEADFARTPSIISWTPNKLLTVSLNATSTFPYVPNVGDVAQVLVYNATTTAGAGGTITWDAGDGLTLLKSEDDGAVTTAKAVFAKFTFIRTSAWLVTAILENTVGH